MREFSVPNAVEIPDDASLTDVVFEDAANWPEAVVISRKSGDRWTDVTARQFRDDVVGLAKGLVAKGVEPGERVCLMSRTRYEWAVCDYAIWSAGAVTVPIYDTSSADQARWILGDSGASAAFAETGENERVIRALATLDQAPNLEHVWQIEGGALDELREAGADIDDATIDRRRRASGADELATIIYTSGTTGPPKGCALTHRNLLFDVRSVTAGGLDELFRTEGASTLLFLPLAHVLARIIQIGCLEHRVLLGHSANIKNVLNDLAEFRPRFILAMPRVFEKAYNSAAQKAEAAGRGKVFEAAANTAIAYSQALDAGGPGPVLRLKRAAFDKLVYAKLREALGGRASHAVSGSAPLGEQLGHFFRGVGISVLEGYGLTETSGAAAVNVPGAMKVGTVGRPLPGTSVRIADDGEILIAGPHVFRGWWNNPSATADVLDADGWLYTGDLGNLDEDGFLSITGRKKDIIVTAGGKNVAPAELEDRVRRHPLVSQCMVIGDQRPYAAALITLDAEAFESWKERQGKPADASPEELRDDPDLLARIQSAVDDANSAVSRAESIRRFRVLPDDFTEEDEQLTPTLKVRRANVAKDYAEEIEALYA